MGLGQFIRATAERQRFQVGVELRQKTFECRLNGRLAQTAKIDTEGLLVERQIHNVQTSTRVQQCRQNSTSPPFVHSAAVVQPNFSENPSREAIECRFQPTAIRPTSFLGIPTSTPVDLDVYNNSGNPSSDAILPHLHLLTSSSCSQSFAQRPWRSSVSAEISRRQLSTPNSTEFSRQHGLNQQQLSGANRLQTKTESRRNFNGQKRKISIKMSSGSWSIEVPADFGRFRFCRPFHPGIKVEMERKKWPKR
jgi:hypothetical protein